MVKLALNIFDFIYIFFGERCRKVVSYHYPTIAYEPVDEQIGYVAQGIKHTEWQQRDEIEGAINNF